MGRPRILTDEQRLINKRKSALKWYYGKGLEARREYNRLKNLDKKIKKHLENTPLVNN